jgi:arginine-tRNA-protein transferase
MRELLVYDELSDCHYLAGQIARLPLRRPIGMSEEQFDQRLAAGDRRMGRYLYRTQCPACQACEPIRVPIAEFTPVRTHKRTLRRGDELLRVSIGPPQCDQTRVDLFNRHKQGRGLAAEEGELDLHGYFSFLLDSCTKTLEFSYWAEEQLVAVAISDRGARSLNAVYCYYDPSFEQVSLGTYNVLKQVETCRAWGLDYLYLGLYIAASPRMNYKARFLPHERLVGGAWRRFEKSRGS